MDAKKSITIKDISVKLWTEVRRAALAAGKSVPDFVTQLFQQALNGKAK